MAPRAGFEPATDRLTVDCSTTELPGNVPEGCKANRLHIRLAALSKGNTATASGISIYGPQKFHSFHKAGPNSDGVSLNLRWNLGFFTDFGFLDDPGGIDNSVSRFSRGSAMAAKMGCENWPVVG